MLHGYSKDKNSCVTGVSSAIAPGPSQRGQEAKQWSWEASSMISCLWFPVMIYAKRGKNHKWLQQPTNIPNLQNLHLSQTSLVPNHDTIPKTCPFIETRVILGLGWYHHPLNGNLLDALVTPFDASWACDAVRSFENTPTPPLETPSKGGVLKSYVLHKIVVV